ncbi:MAG: hypothetical protein HQ503_05310 [Rhodospirillales bacterium]|nr:hypothetical protein [Rhodospirillales bacterium]
METLSESIKLMFFVYALAAAISLVIAWIIKLIFAGIQMRKARAGKPGDGQTDASNEATDTTPERTA